MMRTMSPLIDGLYRQGEKIADTKAPHDVPIARRWEQRKFNAQLVNPANRRKLDIIVVGSHAERRHRVLSPKHNAVGT